MGIELFSQLHPTAGSVEINELTTPADLAAAALDQAMADMETTIDHRGKLAGIRPTLLIIPPILKRTAFQLLGSSVDPSGTPDIDNYYKGLLNSTSDSGITDADSWYLLAEGSNPLLSRVRVPYNVERFEDPATRTNGYVAEVAFLAVVKDWRGIYGTAGA